MRDCGRWNSATPQETAGHRALWCRTAQPVQQPIGGGVQKEAELVGFPAVAGGAAGFRVEFMLFDQILHGAAAAAGACSAILIPEWVNDAPERSNCHQDRDGQPSSRPGHPGGRIWRKGD